MENDLLSVLLNFKNVFGRGNRGPSDTLLERLASSTGEGGTEEEEEWAPSSEGMGGWAPSGWRNVDRMAQGWLDEGYDNPNVIYNPSGVYGESSGMSLTEDALAKLEKKRTLMEWVDRFGSAHSMGHRNLMKYDV